MIPLTKLQREIMEDFYNYAPERVIFNKKERDRIWKETKYKSKVDLKSIKEKCPALAHQIEKSYKTDGNIQSAVFSECVYAQTYANMLGLSVFKIVKDTAIIPCDIEKLLKSYNLVSRYLYTNAKQSKMLIQAGGCNGIDSALIIVSDLNIYTIEFKEPGAKTSEPDLPKYDEDGMLRVTAEFLNKYPQFEEMLKEQKGLNFFDKIGTNINNFSKDSINIAVSNNYTKKYADVICTEDINGYLVMMPANQVSLWANTEGEIRPAGRNKYKVWTSKALNRFLKEKHANINGKIVNISKSELKYRKPRGGKGIPTGYKINSLFFIYIKDCKEISGRIIFNIEKVWQLNPTIAAKLFFKELNYSSVKDYYSKCF